MKAVKYTLVAAGALLILGSAGACDVERIGFCQAAVQAIIGTVMVLVGMKWRKVK